MMDVELLGKTGAVVLQGSGEVTISFFPDENITLKSLKDFCTECQDREGKIIMECY